MNRTRAVRLTRDNTLTFHKWLAAGALALGALVAAQAVKAEGGAVTKSHGYSFYGDLKYPADFEHLDYVNPNAPKGGEISQWAPGTFDSFNNYTRKGRAGALSSIGHESLLTTFADDPTAQYCFLCETMEYPEDISWVKFNLRPDVTFPDGTKWTAQDLKFTFDLFMEQGLPSFRAAFGAFIDTVEVIDDHTIQFNFTEESPKRDRIGLAGIFSAFSQDWFEENEVRLDEGSLTPIMGTGPYMLEDYRVNQRIVYKRRDDYWGETLPHNVGRNNFDRIRIEYFADSTAALEAFKAGEYTFRNENNSKQWATGYDFPGIEKGWVIKEALSNGSLAPGQSFVFNLRREKFQDRRVREAIGLMFNFEWSNESLFYGLYSRVESFWGNSDLQAQGAPSAAELAILQPLVDDGLVDASILSAEAIIPPVSGDARQNDRRNFRKASKLLDEAGWEVGDDGIRRKNGEPLVVEFLESSPAFDRVISPFVQNLERLGVQAKLDRVDPAQETERSRNYDFDMTTHSFSMELEPSTSLEQWFGSEARDGSTRNLMGLADPAVDRLIDTVVAAETRDDMKTAVHALDRVLRQNLFWTPQWFKDTHTIAYFAQYEYPETLPPYALGELDFWWYNAEKAARLKAEGALR